MTAALEDEMSRSPIEMMVDKACGLNEPAKESTDDNVAEALVAIADAAIAWKRGRSIEKMTPSEAKLALAVKQLQQYGW